MKLHQVTSASLTHPRRCSACDQPIKRSDQIVNLYGETFHYDCAFYRRLSRTGRRPGAA